MNCDKEVVPGLTTDDIENIAGQIYKRNDGNHPQYAKGENNDFTDILENFKPDISASPIFIKKVSLQA